MKSARDPNGDGRIEQKKILATLKEPTAHKLENESWPLFINVAGTSLPTSTLTTVPPSYTKSHAHHVLIPSLEHHGVSTFGACGFLTKV